MGKLIRRVILEAIIQHLGKYNSFFTLYKRMDIYLNHALIYVCMCRRFRCSLAETLL